MLNKGQQELQPPPHQHKLPPQRSIDTQGFDDTQGLDAQHVQQMVEFLLGYPHRVNGVVLVINVHNDRFGEGTKKLIRLMDNYVGWDCTNRVGLVTRIFLLREREERTLSITVFTFFA